MNSKVNYKVEDFLRDDEFICYALNVSSEACMKWEGLLKKYSNLVREAELAKAILRGEDTTYTIASAENDELKKRLFESLSIS